MNRRKRLLLPALLWLSFTFLASAVPGYSEMRGELFVPFGEFVRRLPHTALLTLPFLVFYWWHEIRLSRHGSADEPVVCALCNSTRQGRAGQLCPCGGVLKPLEEMKWVEDVTGISQAGGVHEDDRK